MADEKNQGGLRSPSSHLLLWAILFACFGCGVFLLFAPWTVTTWEEQQKNADMAKKMEEEEEEMKRYPGMKKILEDSESAR